MAIALVLSLIVAGAAPAQAASTTLQSDQLAVGSAHTDFGTGDEPNPQTLTNLTKSGTGDSATIQLVGDTIVDSAEDQDLAEYSGDTADFNVTSTFSPHGDYGIEGNTPGTGVTIHSTSGLPAYPSAGDTFSVDARVTSTDDAAVVFFGYQDSNNFYRTYFDAGNNELVLEKASGGSFTTLKTTSYDFQPDTDYELVVDWGSDGTITVDANTGGSTVATAQGSDSEFTSGGIAFQAVNCLGCPGSSSTVYFDDLRILGTTSDSAFYEGAIHDVSNAEQAAINITEATNVSVEATVRTDGGTVLNQTTLSGTGNHTLVLAETSSSQLETVLDINVTGSQPHLTLADESILFTNHAPQADNLSPPNGTELSSSTPTFSVDVSDQEFPTAQSDEVTAELFVDGSSVGSKTVTSNSTVQLSTEITQGGDHTYHWELTDSYGATTTTSTNTVSVPSTLYLYKETANSTGAHELLDGVNASVEVTITGSAGSVKAVTVSDGKVDMSGLPADESYVFTVDADGYYAREIYIESIYDQAAVFLLNNSLPAVQNSLTVSDTTGQYQEPIITVERVINTSRVGELPDNGDQWVTIGGDRLGASGFYIVNLQQYTRYRFVVINQQGNTRVLGEYTAKADGEVPLEIGSIQYDLSPDNNAYQWTTAATNESGNPAVTFAYEDAGNLTDYVNVTIRYRNNSAVVASKNFTAGPYGEVVFTEPVNASEYNNREFVVVWDANRNGSVVEGKRIVGGKRDIRPPLADVWMEIAYGGGVLVLAFVAGAGAGAAVAAATVSVFAGLAVFLGLAPPGLGFGATILALFLSVAMLVYSGSQQV